MNSGDHYYLQPGFIFVPEKALNISTVIGSGAAVCIFDRKNRIGGMNHFQLPYMAKKGRTTAIYGNIATITLIRMMMNAVNEEDSDVLDPESWEASKKNFEAQIFGGAFNPEKQEKDIGKENIEIARRILKKAGISIISEDTGGEKGRKIIFNTSTNEAAVLKVDNLREADWYPYQ